MPVYNTCGVEKSETKFPKNGHYLNGQPRRRPDCTTCYNIKSKHNKFVNNTKHRTGEKGTYDLKDWRDALIFFEGCCAYCSAPQSRRKKLTRDHVLAVSKGGKTIRVNIVPGCNSCNCSKADELVEVWYPRQKFFTKERFKKIIEWRYQ